MRSKDYGSDAEKNRELFSAMMEGLDSGILPDVASLLHMFAAGGSSKELAERVFDKILKDPVLTQQFDRKVSAFSEAAKK